LFTYYFTGHVHRPQPVVVDGTRLQTGDRFRTDRHFACARADFAADCTLPEGFGFAVFKVVLGACQIRLNRAGEDSGRGAQS